MNRKHFLTLLIAVLALGGIALTLMKREQSTWEDASGRVGQSLLPDFDINNVAQATFTGSKGVATLASKDGAWRVKERNDYPADFKGLSELLIKLRELKILQVEAIAAEQRPRMELTLPGGKDEKPGTLLELKDAAGKPLAALLLGKDYMRKVGPHNASYPTGRFVMVGKDAQALSAAQSVFVVGDTLTTVASKPEAWLRKEFFKIAKLKSLAVQGEDAAHSWKITRATPQDFWKLEGAGAAEEFDPVNGNQAAGALEEMLLSDVSVGAADDVTGLRAPISVTAQTFDNLSYDIKIGNKKDDGRHLRVALSGEPAKERPAAADEKAEDKEALDKAFKDELAALDARVKQERSLSDWTFVAPGWKLEPLLKSRAQLLVDKSKPRPLPQAGTPSGLPPGMQLPGQ